MQRRLAAARIGHLATAGADGRPHVVPVTFALEEDAIFFAVDAKPKRTTNLTRLRNITANPRVALLVDHYEEEWTGLWWVRVDGTARVLAEGPSADHAQRLLASKYEQYRAVRPPGPVVAISIDRMTGWSAADHAAR